MADKTNLKATLASGKVVVMRPFTIADQESAAIRVADKAKGNTTILQMLMQKEVIKMLIVTVDGKTLSGLEKEQLDNVFTMGEYLQVMKVLEEMMGNVESPKIEFVSGDK